MITKLIEGYISHILENHKSPESVYAFAKHVGIEEKEFYDHFTSFEALEQEIFNHWFVETKQQLEQTEVYQAYSAREKVLGLFFAWIEKLKANRSFVVFMFNRKNDHIPLPQFPHFLKSTRASFLAFAQELMRHAVESNEIHERKFISEKYDEALWVNLLFVMGFWVKDTSKSFEKTDEAIERSVNLAFDLMGKSPLDSMISFGKFLFQNR